MRIFAIDPGPTQSDIEARIREHLAYCQATGVLRWIKRPKQTRVVVGESAGCMQHRGYPIIKVGGKIFSQHRVAWFLHTGAWPASQLDHVDGDRANNRIYNLREATPQQNAQNRKASSVSATGLLGVSKNKDRATFRGTISGRHLGTFQTPESAHAAYRAAKRDMHEFSPEVRP